MAKLRVYDPDVAIRDGCKACIALFKVQTAWQTEESAGLIKKKRNGSGALTQLVECHLCKVDVKGSNPLCSTKSQE